MATHLLVTGASGLIGWHLVEAAARRGDAVTAWIHSPIAAEWESQVVTEAVELSDRAALTAALRRASPDVIVHLGARSLVEPSWEDPARTYAVNVLGTIHLIEAARLLPKSPRILLAGSSAEYAEPVNGGLIAETAPLGPNSPYASSKRAADDFAQLCVRRYGQDIVRFRPFYLVGPRKVGDVCSDFARRIVAIERGQQSVIRVGDLRPVRDMMDVRDGAAALLRIIDAGGTGEVYNICCGTGTSIEGILNTYCRLARIPVTVVHDAALLRPLDQRSKIGDPAKLRALGWRPMYALDETLHGILNYWRTMPA